MLKKLDGIIMYGELAAFMSCNLVDVTRYYIVLIRSPVTDDGEWVHATSPALP